MSAEPAPLRRMPLPGVAAIAFYMLLVAGIIIVGVVDGGHYPPPFLAVSIIFVTASAGLIAGFRWAWALSLAAVFMLACMYAWQFSHSHQFPQLALGGLNLVFFLYLIRPEVRSKLR
jgi:hypothetical protein